MINYSSKGQINIEFLAAAFIYLIALGGLMTLGSGILPGFSDNMEKKSLNIEAAQVSNEILNQPGHHTVAGGGTNWHTSDQTVNNVDALGVGNSSNSSFLILDRDKINSLRSFERGTTEAYINYSEFKNLTDVENQYRFKFTWTPIIDTGNDYFRTSLNPLNESMLGYWHLDNINDPLPLISPDVLDASGNENHGSNRGAERGIEGVFGTNAMNFSLGDARIEIPRNDRFDGGKNVTISVSAWFYVPESPIGENPIVSKKWDDNDGDWELILEENCPASANECRGAPPYVGFYSEALSRGGAEDFEALVGPVSTGEWHHAVFGLNQPENELRLYLDGEVRYNEDIPEVSNETDSNVYIGSRVYENTNVNEQFDGLIDEVRIYNRTISGSTVRRLYSEGPPNIIEPQTAYYDSAENIVHYGRDTLNGSEYKFLLTAHNGRYNTTYVSSDWDFRGVNPVGLREKFSIHNEDFTVVELQNRENDRGSVIVISQNLNTFGPRVDSDAQLVRLDRYVVMEEEPMRVEVLAW